MKIEPYISFIWLLPNQKDKSTAKPGYVTYMHAGTEIKNILSTLFKKNKNGHLETNSGFPT